MEEGKTKYRPCSGTAVLKVKFLGKTMNPESELFENIIASPYTLIKVDFNTGISLVEDGFKKSSGTDTRFYLEFYDDFKNRDFVEYLTSDNSDYRVTTEDGVIIRLASNDEKYMKSDSSNMIKKKNNKPLGFFKTLRKMIVWK